MSGQSNKARREIARPWGAILALAVFAVVMLTVLGAVPRVSVEDIGQWTLIVATVTFVAVLAQIIIAHAELKAVNATLELAIRKAKLYVTAIPFQELTDEDWNALLRSPNDPDRYNATVSLCKTDLSIYNTGTRTNKLARIVLCLPPGWGVRRYPDGTRDGKPEKDEDPSLRCHPRFVITVPQPIFPDDHFDARYLILRYDKVPLESKPGDVYWRAVYEDGATPSHIEYERLSDKLPQTGSPRTIVPG